jgi:peptidoglycan/LPS O-acetylase OafA/YrhL
MKYRAEIDGLRAVAVVPVVLFHAGLPGGTGGFIGVDIFFVISGYLISKIIASEISEHRFSLARFYERRARRILPAFLFVVAITTLAALILLLPQDLAAFGRTLTAASLSGSNIFFWWEAGDYFADKSDLKPLLHTWSLGVEEQFYIVFPLILLGLRWLRGWRFLNLAVWSGLVLSLALAIYGTRTFTIATFYLLPTRAWELLAGTVLAIGAVPAFSRRLHAEIAATLGLIAIALAVTFYDSRTPFPGLAAIPPVLGAALIIHSGSGPWQTAVGRLLAHPVLRGIGLISFSLYLWHWPLIVFAKYYFIRPDVAIMAAVVVAGFVLAYLSWRFVEQPFRHPQRDRSPLRPLIAASLGIVLASGAGVALSATHGLPGRVSPQIVAFSDKSTHQGPRRDCGFAFDKRRTIDTLCVLGAPATAPSFVIVGDSHGDAMAPAVFEAAAAVGRAGYQITATGYRPVIGYEKKGERAKYAYLNRLVLALLDSHPEITDVIVSPYWHQAVVTDDYFTADGKEVSGAIGIATGLEALVDRYPTKRFLITGDTADSDIFGAQPAARDRMFHRAFDPKISREDFERSREPYVPIQAALARRANVRLLDLAAGNCDQRFCYGEVGGTLVYTDDNHLSFDGAKRFLPALKQFLDKSPCRTAGPATGEAHATC